MMRRGLYIGDQIVIIAPRGVQLGLADGSCNNLKWDATFSWDPMNNMMRTCPFCVCKDHRLTMTVTDDRAANAVGITAACQH